MATPRPLPLVVTLCALDMTSLCFAQGPEWTLQQPATAPSARSAHAMTYDSFRARTVLFSGSYNDTTVWEWQGSIWVSKKPVSGPSGRRYHAMAYDAARRTSLLFGGTKTITLYDTWEWDGARWTQRQPANKPSPRLAHAMAYDAGRQRTVLFGGDDGFLGLHRDTWEWDGTMWRNLRPAVSPPARARHAMAYDSIRGRTVLFGGTDYNVSLQDTWEWDGANWHLIQTQTSPPAMKGHAMAFDSARGRTVLFGNKTWEWDGRNWAQPKTTTTPAQRTDHAMVYDAARQRTVLFGGLVSGKSAETWEYGLPAGQFIASFTRYGNGCGNSSDGPVSLAPAAGSRAVVGRTFRLVTHNFPHAATIGWMTVGLSNQRFGSTPLPMDLGSIGMPGCWLWHSLDGAWSFPIAAGSGTFSAFVPNVAGLPGSRVFFQAVAGRYTSNGGDVIVGNFSP